MENNFWQDKTVLVTGGAGFIGSHLVLDLVPLCKKVIVVDNFERGSEANLTPVIDQVEIHNVDLVNPSLRKPYHLSPLFKGVDVVYHLASKVGGIGVYLNKKYEIFDSNVLIDRNVLEAAIRARVPYYFYASSAHVYPLNLQTSKNASKIKEAQAYPANPLLSYGWAKLIAEMQIQSAVEENDFFNAAIARYIGIYGRNLDYQLDTGSVIPVFSHRAIKYPKVPFDIWGTGAEKRSYCFIDDAIECSKLMVQKLDQKKLVGPLNVGKQERVSIKKIAKKIIDISGKDVKIHFDATKETQIWCQWCDCSAARKLLGWEAQTSLEEGLRVVYRDIAARVHNE